VSFVEYMNAGGSIMWIILGISVVAAALIIERLIFFAMASADPFKLEASFKKALAEGDANAALSAVKGRSSMHRLFFEAWSNWSLADPDMSTLLEQQLRREIYRWGENLTFLEIAAKVSPLLGLLGTVLGMVEMFQTLNMGNTVNAATVTGGIWKALFTTVAGLTVAIPAIVAHGLLCGRIEREEESLRRGADFIIRERMGYRKNAN
jgi:biopolymer transport protein ExbB